MIIQPAAYCRALHKRREVNSSCKKNESNQTKIADSEKIDQLSAWS